MEADVEALLDRHFGGLRIFRERRLAGPETAGDHFLVRLQFGAVGDRVFAGERAARADVLVARQIDRAAANAGHARAQHRNQPRIRGVRRLARRQKGAHRLHLRREDLDQEHVGAAAGQLERQLTQQVGLHRAHADDEEAAQTHREQDDARLVARTPEAEHRVPEGERARACGGPHRPHDAAARQVQHDRHGGEAAADDQSRAQR